jgi:tagaturonate reductase
MQGMLLSKQTITAIRPEVPLLVPDPKQFDLPEKVLQFGTGVFLRGLIDYFIDKANREGLFNGRVVMVKSTAAGDINAFREQDCLYTLLMKSVENGAEVDEKIICAGLSRVLDAGSEWDQVLACAFNPDLKLIISNTTEAGIVPDETDQADASPPHSFPAKLLAFLEQRYKAFNGSADSGMVIVPTELITDNATKLKSIVNRLAQRYNMDPAFINWLNTANDFCNSLVDRIVPGKLPPQEQLQMEAKLGYADKLMIMAESFGLWAIETSSPRARAALSFSEAHPGIHVVDDIEKFRELKLRLLNGSHNLSCALAHIAGFATVREAMANPDFESYMQGLILNDIASAILSDKIFPGDARSFGLSVIDRYRNPHIAFDWLSICVQDTSKIRIRAIPIIRQHDAKHGFVPDHISLGFAAYILFMRSERMADGRYEGNINGRKYLITDDFAGNLCDKWKNYTGAELVKQVLEDQSLWETDLFVLHDFAERVGFFLGNLEQQGFFKTASRPYKDVTLFNH